MTIIYERSRGVGGETSVVVMFSKKRSSDLILHNQISEISETLQGNSYSSS